MNATLHRRWGGAGRLLAAALLLLSVLPRRARAQFVYFDSSISRIMYANDLATTGIFYGNGSGLTNVAAATASALAANGANCAAGSFPLGVDSAGAAELCTTVSSLAPTLTGGGASGTWGISITGNAATAGGLAVHAGVNNEANKIVRTDASGYLYAGWINTISGDNGVAAISRVYASSDGFLRYYTLGNFASQIGGNLFNNSGLAHGTYTDFNVPPDFGYRYIMGTLNGPGIPAATQYYNWGVGLGSDYAYGSYAMQMAIPRTPSGGNPYLSVRYREAGVWGGWSRIQAGYADTAGSVSALAANGSNCAANSFPLGVDAAGNAEACSTSISGNAATASAVAWTGITGRPGWMTAANLIADLGNASNSVPSGFYQANNGLNYPSAGTWYNLLNVRHSNTANDHGFQLAASYYSSDFFTRTYQGGTGVNDGVYTPWSRLNYSRSWVGGAGTTGGAGTYGNTWRLGSSAADGTGTPNTWLYLYNGAGSAYHDLAAGNIWSNGSFQNGTITSGQVLAGLYAQGNREMATNDNVSTSYSVAALELRESQYGATAAFLPPRLAFHWGGVVASQIAVENTGRIAIRDNPGTGYENLIARDLYGSANVYFGTGGSYKVTSAGVGTLATTTLGSVLPPGDGTVGYDVGRSTLRWAKVHAVNHYGAYNAGPDLAERYPASEAVEPGDVVVFDLKAPADKLVFDQSATKDDGTVVAGRKVPVAVRRSTTPYQNGIIGVVSTSPGVRLADPDDEKNPPIALVGRVPVKVCNQNGPIRVGDRLTSSSRPGYAMRATAHGPAVAIALQAFVGKEGRVLAFIQTGEANAGERLRELGERVEAQDRAIAELRKKLEALKAR